VKRLSPTCNVLQFESVTSKIAGGCGVVAAPPVPEKPIMLSTKRDAIAASATRDLRRGLRRRFGDDEDGRARPHKLAMKPPGWRGRTARDYGWRIRDVSDAYVHACG